MLKGEETTKVKKTYINTRRQTTDDDKRQNKKKEGKEKSIMPASVKCAEIARIKEPINVEN